MKQLELIPRKPEERRKRILRAHVTDAGEGQGDHPYGAEFKCNRCEWESGWFCFDNITEIRRGLACPNCNNKST